METDDVVLTPITPEDVRREAEERAYRAGFLKGQEPGIRSLLFPEGENFVPSLSDKILAKKEETGFRVNSGFPQVDSIVQGFRSGNTYLVAGLEKSGKSSFLMNILNNLLEEGNKVGYINTELRDNEFAERMAAIYLNRPTSEIEADPILREQWALSVNKNFFFAGVEDPADLKENNVLSFNKTIGRLQEFVMSGAKVLMVDNLTTFNTLSDSNRKGWEILASCMMRVINFAKENNVVVFVVIHTKPNVVYAETSGGLKKIIDDDPRKILRDQVIVTKRPTLTDVYGGGTALSQLSGAILIWRPYQKFNEENFKEITSVILDSLRHGSSGKDVEMVFKGDKSKFYEIERAEGDLDEMY